MKNLFWKMITHKDCWAGAFTGLIGAQLLAMNNAYSGWGFAFFLLSNLFMLMYGFAVKARGLILMQMGFTVTSLQGIYHYFLAYQS